MLRRARANRTQMSEDLNISFVEGRITSIPLEDEIADCVISNCVINLVPEAEKPAVFAEIGRILKPGGRVAISDILARKPLSPALRMNVALYVSCIAGCSSQEDYICYFEANGFHGKLAKHRDASKILIKELRCRNCRYEERPQRIHQ
jgi:arsenite methyltransferase